ncbi:MarR family winged helix-turn-helix transcriptional regulator [Janibacter sp. G1551]|uniref:MarR family winged helix-turn-helix transcriptional regulator n=1 Tax=Janibacter sp. G1551 TaxID=3420440 RepID=UPI003CFC1CCE
MTPTPTRREVSDLAIDVRLACMRISRRVRFESSSEIAPHRFGVLAKIEDGLHTATALAESERVSAPSMSRTIKALAEDGLVTRTPDPDDGRNVILELTPEGAAMLRRVRRRRDAWMTTRVAALSAEEQHVLRRAADILARVAAE